MNNKFTLFYITQKYILLYMNLNFDIEQFLSLNGYDNEIRKTRRKRNSENSTTSTQEFFTPYSIVKRMCDKIPDEDWSDPTKTFLEPCAGNFQFVVYIVWNRLQHGIPWQTALKTVYALELMQDNIDEGRGRITSMLSQLCEDFDEGIANEIMDNNIVCHDFFTWNFEEWREMTEEELKKKK